MTTHPFGGTPLKFALMGLAPALVRAPTESTDRCGTLKRWQAGVVVRVLCKVEGFVEIIE